MSTMQELSAQLRTDQNQRFESHRVDLDILDLLLPLVERKYVILLGTCMGLLFGLVIALLTKNQYTANAVVMPPQQAQSSAGFLTQLGGLASISGLGGAMHDPNELYMDLLQSEAVQFNVIKQANLEAEYHMPSPSTARLVLSGRSKFVSLKGGLLMVSVKDESPRQAAAIAHAYVEQLHNINDKLAISEASRRALFFGRELAAQRDRLATAEAALQQTEKTTGAISPGHQTALVIQRIADLQGQISSRELQLHSLHLSSTDQNPDVIYLNNELGVLRSQLRALEGEGTTRKPGDVMLTSQAVPEAQLTYNRKLRDVSYQNYLVELLARQYEAAKLDESKAAPVIQLVDDSHVPEWKSGPNRPLWTLAGGVLAFFVSCAVVVGLHLYYCVTADEMMSLRLAPFKRAWRAGL